MGRPRTSGSSVAHHNTSLKRRRIETPTPQHTTTALGAVCHDNDPASGIITPPPTVVSHAPTQLNTSLPDKTWDDPASSYFGSSAFWTPYTSFDQSPFDSFGYDVGLGHGPGGLTSGEDGTGWMKLGAQVQATDEGRQKGCLAWGAHCPAGQEEQQRTQWSKDLQAWLSTAAGSATSFSEVHPAQNITLADPFPSVDAGCRVTSIDPMAPSTATASSNSAVSVDAVSAGIPVPFAFGLLPVSDSVDSKTPPTSPTVCFCDSSALFQTLRAHLRYIAAHTTPTTADTRPGLDHGTPSTSSILPTVTERTLLSTQLVSTACHSTKDCAQCLADPSTPIAISSVLNLVSQIHTQYISVVRNESTGSTSSLHSSDSELRSGIGVGKYVATGSVGVSLGVLGVKLELEELQRAVRRVSSGQKLDPGNDEWSVSLLFHVFMRATWLSV